MTLEERLENRQFVHSMRYAVYDGREHDLYLAVPDFEKLQRCFKLVFDKEGQDPPLLLVGKYKYYLEEPPLLTQDNGYLAIQGKYKGSKGLHKIKLHRLAYQAFYKMPDTTMHIHHIDRDKKNNSAANLVALTEEEHCQVHGRDVRVPRNLFTKLPERGLLAQQSSESVQTEEQTIVKLARMRDRAFSSNSLMRAEKLTKKIDTKLAQNPGLQDELRKALQEEATRAFTKIDDVVLKQVEERLVEPKVLSMLSAEPTPENMATLIAAVKRQQYTSKPSTVLELLCTLAENNI